jgi:hypothetical protein
MNSDVFLRAVLGRSAGARVDMLFGYQFSRIDEKLLITSTLTATANAQLLNPGTTLDLFDIFDTRNEFHGGTIGLLFERRYGCFSMDLMTKFGFGSMSSTVTLVGQSTIDDGNVETVDNQGLLVRDTNSGVHHRREFCFVPEFSLRGGWHLSECVELTCGYSFTLWTESLQAGNQIDRDLAVNPDDPPVDQQRPELRFHGNEHWAHGLSVGLRFEY